MLLKVKKNLGIQISVQINEKHIQISVQINEEHTSKSVSKSMKNTHPNQCPNQWKTHILQVEIANVSSSSLYFGWL